MAAEKAGLDENYRWR